MSDGPQATQKTVLVTGASGFIGKNLRVALGRCKDVEVLAFDLENPTEDLERMAAKADLVFHLAGVNRPKDPKEFTEGNADLTLRLCRALTQAGRKAGLVLSSSIQAAFDNPYGVSKKAAEEAVFAYAASTGSVAHVFRLPNVFGKWCRPNYNSAVATFCHNIARGLPITVDDPSKKIRLVYVDEVVKAFLGVLDGAPGLVCGYATVPVEHEVTLGEIVRGIRSFRESRTTHVLPNMADAFQRALYATYLSYLPTDDLAYSLEKKADQRGMLAEVLKSSGAGQLFFSTTRPGFVRGNHYHDSKVEKFVVVHGQAIIRLQHLVTQELVEIAVDGRDLKVVDIPPGYTHNIENVGQDDVVTLFWANEMFDPSTPDAYYLEVRRG
jgi:UDP-2-acetamido-2,6-beta-L-arabino-hexul-4-ose reductase